MNNFGGLGLTVKSSEYRLCEVNGKKALFHRWVESDSIFFNIKSFCSKEDLQFIMRNFKDHNVIFEGRAGIEKVKSFYGLVEYEDGTLEKVDPENIKFNDSSCKFKECGGN